MCDVIQQPIVVKLVGGVPSENPTAVVSNAIAGCIGRPYVCSVSTQTDNVDAQLAWLSDFDKEVDFHLHDLEQDGDAFQLDFVPYGGLRCGRVYKLNNARYALCC